MKKILVLCTTTALLLQVAFAQMNPLLKYLPDNASMLISFNPVELGKKVPGETFRQSPLYKELLKNKKLDADKLLANPSQWGINFTEGLVIVLVSDTTGEKDIPAIHLFGVLKDEPLFAQNIQKISGEKDSLHVYGTNKILFAKDGGGTLAWNNEIFVLNMGADPAIKKEMSSVFDDTTDTKNDTSSFEKRLNQVMEQVKKMQRDLCFGLLTPHPENKLSADIPLARLFDMPGDIKFWNSGMINPLMGKNNPLAAVIGQFKSGKGNSKTAVVNFEKGKIVVRGYNYIDPSMTEIYKQYPSNAINPDLARRLPPGKVLGMINLSFNHEMAKQLLHKSPVGSVMDSLKSKLPFDPAQFEDIFKSDLMLAVYKSEQPNPADTITEKMGGIELLLAVPIANKTKFEEWKTVVKKIIDSLKNDPEGSGKMLKNFKPVLRYDDTTLVMSLSPYTAAAFLKNIPSGAIPRWLQDYTHNPMVIRIDLHELLELLFSKNPGGVADRNQKKLLDMISELIIYGGNFESEAVSSTLEFRLSNQDENALEQFFKLITSISKANERIKIPDDVKNEPVPEPFNNKKSQSTTSHSEGTQTPLKKGKG